MVRKLVLLSAGMVLILLAGLFVYLAALEQGPDDPLRSLQEPLWDVPDFALIDARGHPVKKSDLAGRTWLAAFVFTRCPGPCPLISQKMSGLQEALRERDDFLLVSFSVDPDYDRPEVLAEYSYDWNADPARWWFLTEDDPGEMARVTEGFKIAVQRGLEQPGGAPDITHGTHLLLVDRQGRVRAVFRSTDEDLEQQVSRAVWRLAAE